MKVKNVSKIEDNKTSSKNKSKTSRKSTEENDNKKEELKNDDKVSKSNLEVTKIKDEVKAVKTKNKKKSSNKSKEQTKIEKNIKKEITNNKLVENQENSEEKGKQIEEVKDIKEIGEVIKKERKRKLPEEIQKKIFLKVISNIFVGSIIILFFIFIILGHKNITREVFITDLKVFSVAILIFSIILFENAYKRENKSLGVFGIEILVLAISNIGLLYVCIMNDIIFMKTVLIMAGITIVYYIIKSIIVFLKMKKSYYKENSELSETIEEEV